jgi:two-component system chemotaxis response regulator CheB
MEAGAVDFVRKPDGQQGNAAFIASLAQKVIMASSAKVRYAVTEKTVTTVRPLGNVRATGRVLVGIGASTGGTEAMLEVMKHLPEDIPPMVVVQHMPTGFTKIYADRLNRLCRMEVREAKDGDELRQGLALIAPADLQCRVVRSGTKYLTSCKAGEKISGHRPSVDALFQSMAENVQCKMVGIIMTGMGQDGAAGLLAMRKKGAFTIGQDEETSVVYGMPGVAYKIGAVAKQAPLENIAPILLQHLRTLS